MISKFCELITRKEKTTIIHIIFKRIRELMSNFQWEELLLQGNELRGISDLHLSPQLVVADAG